MSTFKERLAAESICYPLAWQVNTARTIIMDIIEEYPNGEISAYDAAIMRAKLELISDSLASAYMDYCLETCDSSPEAVDLSGNYFHHAQRYQLYHDVKTAYEDASKLFERLPDDKKKELRNELDAAIKMDDAEALRVLREIRNYYMYGGGDKG